MRLRISIRGRVRLFVRDIMTALRKYGRLVGRIKELLTDGGRTDPLKEALVVTKNWNEVGIY